jgi:gas vesicle protein GvpL/GvpF
VSALAPYLYGVVRAGSLPPATLDGTRGVDPSHELRLVEEAGLAAIVGDVSRDDFGEEALRSRLADPTWLERTALVHEEVLERALAATTVVPFRICTVYRTDDDLRAFMAGSAEQLAAVLRRVDGAVELGVKAYLDDERLCAMLVGAAAAATDGSGRDYLLQRARERRLEHDRARFVADCAAAIHDRLSAEAADAVRNPPPPHELSHRDGMILNGAYLVPGEGGALRAAVTALRRHYAHLGLDLEVTGPWPPFNFVPRELSAP